LNTLNKIKPKFEDRKICPLCWSNKDKLGNILEKGSIVQYLKGDQAKTEVKETKESGHFDMEYASQKIKEDYLTSEYFTKKPSLEKVSCFSCGRIFENAKNQNQLVENLPPQFVENANILFNKEFKEKSAKEISEFYFYPYDDEGDDGDF